MEAGRELDALVAEKVLGWTNIGMGEEPSSRTGDSLQGTNAHGGWMYVSLFSREENAAMHLLQAYFLERRYEAHLSGNGDGWSCELTGPSYGYGYAKTLPHAICLATLGAVGVKLL